MSVSGVRTIKNSQDKLTQSVIVVSAQFTHVLQQPGLRYLTGTADGCWSAIVNMGRFHLLTVVVASLATGN